MRTYAKKPETDSGTAQSETTVKGADTAQRALSEYKTGAAQLRHAGETVSYLAGQRVADPAESLVEGKSRTGLPETLQANMEALSGYSMDDVTVHYNSSEPARIQAHAYTRGTDIHVAPGQEKHLAHEAWHVVQQKQGRVQPTFQLQAGVNINDDPVLEREADSMGGAALRKYEGDSASQLRTTPGEYTATSNVQVVQRSKFGKFGTLLGTMVSGAVPAAVAALAGLNPLVAGSLGAGAYAIGKLLGMKGPYIGGRHNVDTLQAGVGSNHTLGLGFTGKTHAMGHSIVSVDGIPLDQSMGVPLSKGQLVGTAFRDGPPAGFGVYEGFDPGRGRLTNVNIPLPFLQGALNQAYDMHGHPAPYRLGHNDCSTNTGRVLASGGLESPWYAAGPRTKWLWMKAMRALQKVL